MSELYANDFGTILTSPMLVGDDHAHVLAAAPAALQGGQFRAVIGSEIVIVTAGQSGTTWTITRAAEGTTAAAHAAGVSVAHVLTAESLLTAHTTFDVRAFGAVGDRVADDTAALQAAIDAASAGIGGEVLLPTGDYLITSGLSVTGAGVTIRGTGRTSAKIHTTSRTIDMLTVSADHFRMTGVSLNRAGLAATAGSGLYLASGSYASIDNCTIAGDAGVSFYDNVRTLDAHGWTFFNCTISDPVRYGIYVRNTAAPDTGDSTILGCILDSSVASAAAIRIESSGGIRMVDTKVSHHAYAIDLQVADGVTTSVLVVNGNSMESQTTAAVRLGRLGTTGVYGGIVITGNEFLCTNGGDGIVVAEGVYNFIVSGNTMFGASGHYGVDVQAAANMGAINGNILLSFGTGIRLAATAALVSIGVNNYLTVPVPIEDNIYASYAQSWVEHAYRFPVIALTSDSVYRTIATVDLDSVRGCRLDVVLEGTIDWSAVVARSIQKLVSRGAGGNCTVTAVSDTAAGSVIDVQFDVATTPGSVIIGVRRNSGAGGTRFDGALALRLTGHAMKVHVP
jgi:hypothetical protein